MLSLYYRLKWFLNFSERRRIKERLDEIRFLVERGR